MIVSNFAELKRLEKARLAPNLVFLSYSLDSIVESVRMDFFPEINLDVSVFFVSRGPLACILINEKTATIFIHQVLNNSTTPKEVIIFITKHELLHTRIPPRFVDGKQKSHPPEFWEAEKAMSPEKDLIWTWLMTNLINCIKIRPHLERTDVTSEWKKMRSKFGYSLEQINKDCMLKTTDFLL